jgi:hypothetical protein
MEDPTNPDPTKPWSIALPDGTFLYPRRCRRIDAIREGRPPHVHVTLECLPIEPGKEAGRDHDGDVAHLRFETYGQADAFGTELVRVMSMYFPEVALGFIDRAD